MIVENELDEDAEDRREARSYTVTRDDVSAPLSPRFTREVAEKIAGQIHSLYDGREWLRPDWWVELRDVNPQKPLASNGWWRDIHEGETLWIPGYWPMPDSEPPPDDTEASGPLDFLSRLNPFGGVMAEKIPAQHPRLDEPFTTPPPESPSAWNSANFRRRSEEEQRATDEPHNANLRREEGRLTAYDRASVWRRDAASLAHRARAGESAQAGGLGHRQLVLAQPW